MSTMTAHNPHGFAPPDRSLTQRREALERANAIRVARAKLKRDLTATRVCILDVLRDPPACAETAKVYAILLAVPKVGRVKANTAMSRCGISQAKTIGGLSQGQRERLAAHLEGR
jgi:hypothetical protein